MPITASSCAIPTQWFANEPEKGSGVLQYFIGPSGAVVAGLMVNPANGDSLKASGG